MSIDPVTAAFVSSSEPLDVCIVGAGPVGLILALALQHRSKDLKIVIYERQAALYPLPRAVCLDHESLRLLYSLDLAAEIEAIISPFKVFTWRDAKKEVIVDLRWENESVSGHHHSSGFSQPQLESVLEKAVLARGIKIERGWALQGAEDSLGSVTAHFNRWANATGPDSNFPRTVETKYLVGCDGANSTVRKLTDITMEDLKFESDWLIADIIPKDPTNLPTRMTEHGPHQLCDPARPTTIVHAGPGRERLEFMRLQNETLVELQSKDNVWSMLNLWGLSSDNCSLERTAIYTFHARTNSLQAGRIFLAGDSAHLMPPFIGQGMNSGIRDAVALAWRLDAVLSGTCEPALLKSYSTERLGHLQQVTRLAVNLGKAICVTNAAEAEVLHAHLRNNPQPATQYRLGPGLFVPSQPFAGMLSMQRKVRNSLGEIVWFDSLAGAGWTLVSTFADPVSRLSALSKEVFERIDRTSMNLGEGADVNGSYACWLQKCEGAEVLLIRPDFYVAFACKLDALEETFVSYAAGLSLAAK